MVRLNRRMRLTSTFNRVCLLCGGLWGTACSSSEPSSSSVVADLDTTAQPAESVVSMAASPATSSANASGASAAAMAGASASVASVSDRQAAESTAPAGSSTRDSTSPGNASSGAVEDTSTSFPRDETGAEPTPSEATLPDTGSTPKPLPGILSLQDPVPGYASVAGGTSGGGRDLSKAVTVRSMSELQAAVGGNTPAIVLVEPGEYAGLLQPGGNKTIVGLAPGVKLRGNISISGAERSNVILRNIAVQGERCNSYDECKGGADAIYIGNGAHHVWLDHLDVSDGQDGNCDVTKGGDFVTVSWSRFYYTYDKEHRYSNLIAGSDDEPESIGKLNITYMNCHWGERVDQRQPRGRFGNIHMLNNYHNTGGSQIHGVGKDMAMLAENSVYEESTAIWKDMGSPRGWKGVGNIGKAPELNDSQGTVFTVPYDYVAMPASEVVAAVTAEQCGAGNRCTFEQ